MSPRDDHRIGFMRLRQPGPDDIATVVRGLRKSDLLDIIAVTAASPTEALALSMKHAERCYAVEAGGVCIALTGRGYPNSHDVANVWLLGTERFGEILRGGQARYSLEGLEFLLEGLQGAYCVLPADNAGDVRWLRWLGFRVVEELENFRGRGYRCLIMARGVAPDPAARQTNAPPPSNPGPTTKTSVDHGPASKASNGGCG